jgi:hypothetical protein
MPVVRQMTSSMVGTAFTRLTASISASKPVNNEVQSFLETPQHGLCCESIAMSSVDIQICLYMKVAASNVSTRASRL